MGSIPTRSRHPGRPRGPGPTPAAALPPAATPLLAAVLPLAAALLLPAAGSAQEADTARAPADTVRADTAGAAPGAAVPDSTPGPPVTPLGAFARSFVLPGWGQAEVDRPVRGAVYFAAEAASLWMVFKSQSKLASARRGAEEDSALVDSRTAQRENWIVLSVFVALMSGVDAWVSTHLYGFEGQLEPPEDGTAGVQLRYSIPLGAP